MPIFSSIKLYIFAAIFLSVITLGGSGVMYVRGVIAENKSLAQDNLSLINSNSSLQEALDATLETQSRQNLINLELNEKLGEAEHRLTELRTLFLDHDLTNLALEKPGLIERRINDATQRVFDSIESDTSR